MSNNNVVRYNVVKAVVELFHRLPVDDKAEPVDLSKANAALIKHGIYLDASASKAFFGAVSLLASNAFYNTKDILVYELGINMHSFNQSFHKSFGKVASMSDDERLFHQLLHYFTTYGAEAFGVDVATYIPAEELDYPKSADDVVINVIRGISEKEIFESIQKMLSSGMALSKKTQENILTVIEGYDFKVDIESVKNKEFRMHLFTKTKQVPSSPEEMVRYMVFLATGSTMLIKSRDVITRINSEMYNDYTSSIVGEALRKYMKENGAERLASVFYRFKPLFLAFRKGENRSVINFLRRLAVKAHRPAKVKVLDRITSDAENISIEEVKAELENVTIFKMVSCYNAIQNRLAEMDYSVIQSDDEITGEARSFRVRNGKSFSLTSIKEIPSARKTSMKRIAKVLLKAIAARIAPKVAGKTFLIPSNVSYAFPTSEKAFTGSVPMGTAVKLKKESVIGAHWMNAMVGEREYRTDLDLKVCNLVESYGWDSRYVGCDDAGNIKFVFSGDMTDAPRAKGGATEAFYVSEAVKSEAFSVSLTFFNMDEDSLPMPYTLVLDSPKSMQSSIKATESKNEVEKCLRQYVIDKRTVVTSMKSEMETQSVNLGMLLADEKGNKTFYFGAGGVNGVRTVNNRVPYQVSSFLASCKMLQSQLSFEKVLKEAGASVIRRKSKDEAVEAVDLSLNAISKATFTDILG